MPARLAILMTHGTADVVCPPELSRELFETMPCARKSYQAIEGALHEPIHEADREEVWRLAGKWLDGLGLPGRRGSVAGASGVL